MGAQVTEYHRRVAIALRAVRDYLHLTQEQLGEAGDTSGATISRYENAKAAEVQGTILVRIAETLDLPSGVLTNPPATRDEVIEAIVVYRAGRRAERRPH
jgi:transcriptional regulator with XRE-family HTH domain